ncbi:LOW QUALITY PROTEIN: hypothetical protein ACHAXA_002807 [Cyclostephanos tholiformis]|uniref:Uncharacterized protein n=1 Tax=Cyclostephanos tholiformis TaxID=382380 RepID=A0ABD3R5L0_9STRA
MPLVLLENHPKQYGLHEKVDAADDKRKDDIMGTSTSAPSILTKHSHVLPPFNPLLLHKAPKIEPLQMNSLQTKFIVKTMHELRYSNALKRRKTETERGDNYYRDEKVNFSSFRAGNNASDDDSIASLSRSDSSMLDIFDELEAHPNTLPALSIMLAMSLHDVPIVEVEVFPPIDNKNASFSFKGGEVVKLDDDLENKPGSSSSSHLSITLPCKSYHDSSTRYNITIMLVDAAPTKRCFLGILTPCETSSKQEGSCNGDVDYENRGNFDTPTSTNPPSNSLTQNFHDISRQQEGNVKQRIKSLTKEYDAAGSATPLPPIPSSKLLRIDDKFLCRILFHST